MNIWCMCSALARAVGLNLGCLYSSVHRSWCFVEFLLYATFFFRPVLLSSPGWRPSCNCTYWYWNHRTCVSTTGKRTQREDTLVRRAEPNFYLFSCYFGTSKLIQRIPILETSTDCQCKHQLASVNGSQPPYLLIFCPDMLNQSWRAAAYPIYLTLDLLMLLIQSLVSHSMLTWLCMVFGI